MPLQTLIAGGNCARCVVVVFGCVSTALVYFCVSRCCECAVLTPRPPSLQQHTTTRIRTFFFKPEGPRSASACQSSAGYAVWTPREVSPRRSRKKMLPVRMRGGQGVALLVLFLAVGGRVVSSTGECSDMMGNRSGLLSNSVVTALFFVFFLFNSTCARRHAGHGDCRFKRGRIFSSFAVSNFKDPEIKRRFGSPQSAGSLPPSPRRSICELPFPLGAEKSKSPGAQRVIKVFCNVTSWPRRGGGGKGDCMHILKKKRKK